MAAATVEHHGCKGPSVKQLQVWSQNAWSNVLGWKHKARISPAAGKLSEELLRSSNGMRMKSPAKEPASSVSVTLKVMLPTVGFKCKFPGKDYSPPAKPIWKTCSAEEVVAGCRLPHSLGQTSSKCFFPLTIRTSGDLWSHQWETSQVH